jgi:hypothetical protein
MPPTITQFVASFVTPLLVAVVTAVLTVQLSFRRFQAERWWDRKADAYSKIIEALHHILAHTSMTYEEKIYGNDPSEEYKQKVVESYRQSIIDLEFATGVGAYVISDEAAKILTELAKFEPPDENWAVALEDDMKKYERTLAKIRELAKKDLKVR